MCGKAFFLRPDRIFLMNLVSKNAALASSLIDARPCLAGPRRRNKSLNAAVRDDPGEWQDWLVSLRATATEAICAGAADAFVRSGAHVVVKHPKVLACSPGGDGGPHPK
jgi:hypothetical protein